MPGLFGSMLVGVNGLLANSTKMGTISDNIANVSTVGYKKFDTQFQSLVTTGLQSTSFDPGGVLPRPRQLVDQQGIITATSRSTDLAVSGKGFFIVSDNSGTSLDSGTFYTRAGSFDVDNAGNLVNTAGYYLKGFKTDRDGNVSSEFTGGTTISNPNFTDLVTVNLGGASTTSNTTASEISSIALQTTEVFFRSNIPADASPVNTALTFVDTGGDQLIFDGTNGVNASPHISITTTGLSMTIDGKSIASSQFDDANSNSGFQAATFIDSANSSQSAVFSSTTYNGLVEDGTTTLSTNAASASNGFTVQILRSDNTLDTVTFDSSSLSTQIAYEALNGGTSMATYLATLNGATVTGVSNAGVTNTYNLTFSASLNSNNKPEITVSAVDTTATTVTLDAGLTALTGLTLNGGSTTSVYRGSADSGTDATLAFQASTQHFAGNGDFTGDLDAFAAALNGRTVTDSTGSNTYTLAATITNGEFNLTATNASGNAVSVSAMSGITAFGKFGSSGTVDNITSAADSGSDLSISTNNYGVAADFNASDVYEMETTIFDSQGDAHTVTLNFMRRSEDTNLWEVRIYDDDVTGLTTGTDTSAITFDAANGANGGVRFAVSETAADGGTALFTSRLFMKFNGDGSLNQIRTTADGTSGNTLEGETTSGLALNRETTATNDTSLVSIAIGSFSSSTFNSTSTDGSTLTATANASVFTNDSAESMAFEWRLGNPTDIDGDGTTDSDDGTGLNALTNFDSGESVPVIETLFISQDGARLGFLTGVAVDTEGLMTAFYDNGASRPIYKIPVATFIAPNGLDNESGNVYTESEESGAATIRFGRDNGAGDVLGGALENSNVDLGDEFTTMIITQQAFTANTRVVTTTDRMLEEIVRILR